MYYGEGIKSNNENLSYNDLIKKLSYCFRFGGVKVIKNMTENEINEFLELGLKPKNLQTIFFSNGMQYNENEIFLKEKYTGQKNLKAVCIKNNTKYEFIEFVKTEFKNCEYVLIIN